MRELGGRVAVITGAASGIGFATAERLAREGMRIVLADVEAGALSKAEAEMRGVGVETLAVPTDVSDAAQVDALAQRSFEHFGAVHVVFNNAGVEVTGSLWDVPLSDLRWVVDVNLWGVIHGIRAFVPRMLAQGGEGHIVSTASMAGLTSSPFLSIYNATKHAVVTLSESLHKELALLGSPLKVSVVCPGLIKTRIMDSARNRPGDAERDPESPDPSPGRAMLDQLLRQGIESGFAPSVVADQIVEALREERFYVIPTQEELLDGIRQRMEEVCEQRNPAVAALALPNAGSSEGA